MKIKANINVKLKIFSPQHLSPVLPGNAQIFKEDTIKCNKITEIAEETYSQGDVIKNICIALMDIIAMAKDIRRSFTKDKLLLKHLH